MSTPIRSRTTTRPATAAGTVQVWSDLLCPFAHAVLYRLRVARDELGLAGQIHLDHHTFALELFDGPHARPGTDSEAVGVGAIEPGAGFRLWGVADWLYPSSVLLAAEAVHAAKDQGLRQSEELDRLLRNAFWLDSKSIGHRAVILEVAGDVPGLDTAALAVALDTGSHRVRVSADHEVARGAEITGSPQLFLADGTALHNPGIDVRWEGPWAAGYPIAARRDEDWAADFLRRAVQG